MTARCRRTRPAGKLIFVCHPESAARRNSRARPRFCRDWRGAPIGGPRPTTTSRRCSASTSAAARPDSFDDGIRAALERVLVSPDFLFRIEADPAGVAPGTVYRISDVELASRLSFALWSSIPDDTLLDLAIRGKIERAGGPRTSRFRACWPIRARVQSLVQNFFAEWLQTRNVRLLNPESTKFPWFDDNLRVRLRERDRAVSRRAVERGPQHRRSAHVERDLPQRTTGPALRNSGVYGSHFRRVTLTDENRFGLLGKASVLAVTSYTTRTSPTIRGKWLLENILAAPVPAPPPNIPALEASNPEGKVLSVREMLETHRANPVCASCHARMDPLGFSLENFDAIGQWRTTDAGKPIDASGVLLDGTKVDRSGGAAACARWHRRNSSSGR